MKETCRVVTGQFGLDRGLECGKNTHRLDFLLKAQYTQFKELETEYRLPAESENFPDHSRISLRRRRKTTFRPDQRRRY
jgi:hypothetical protein